MRKIKFRGRDIDSGEEVFFDLENILLDVAGSYSEYVCLHNIDPESVAQFVGYDADGREVYEGDILQFDYNGVHYEYKAHLGGFATTESGCYITEKQFGTKKLLPDSFKAELS